MGAVAGNVDYRHVVNLLTGASRNLPAIRSLREPDVGDKGFKRRCSGVQLHDCLIAVDGSDDLEASPLEMGQQNLLYEDLILIQQYFRHFHAGGDP
jgi:hypothetical protein